MYYLNDPKPTQFIDPSDQRFPSLIRYDETMFQDMYEIFGIEKGRPFNPDETTRKTMRQAAADAYDYLRHRLTYQKKEMYYWRILLAPPPLSEPRGARRVSRARVVYF